MRTALKSISVCLLLCGPAWAASTISDYESRVREAYAEIELLDSFSDNSSERVDRVKTLLPVSEEVESGGKTVRVDNGWLHRLLKSYQEGESQQERQSALDQTAHRLNALKSHLERSREASSDEEMDRDEARRQLQTVLSRREFLVNENPITSLVKKVKRRIGEFLQELLLRISRLLFGETAEPGWGFKTVLIVMLAGLLFVAVRAILRIRPRKKIKETVTVLGEDIEEGTTPADLASSALAAAASGDYRTGMRKLYIALLYEFADRGLIELQSNATNREYLARVSRVNALAPVMGYLTDRFDYFWYGMFPSSKDDFSDYLARYREAVASARALATADATK